MIEKDNKIIRSVTLFCSKTLIANNNTTVTNVIFAINTKYGITGNLIILFKRYALTTTHIQDKEMDTNIVIVASAPQIRAKYETGIFKR